MTPPRTQATFATVLGIVLALTVVAHGAEPRALSYVDCSQGLLDQPAWESGDTEFEMEDVNGDGHIDLVSIGDHGNPQINSDEEGLMVWLGNGAGAWSYRHAGQFGYGGVAWGDLNGDGLLEAALGDGTGLAWSPWDDGLATHGQKYGMFSTDLLDADGDGDLDLVP